MTSSFLLLTWIPSASAGQLTGYAWSPNSVPVEIVWSGTPRGLSHDDVVAALDSARSQWIDTSCSAFDLSFVEGDATSNSTDGQNSMVFEDPESEVEQGFLAMSRMMPTGGRVTWNDVDYLKFAEVDIVFNDGVGWMTDAEVEAGDCDGGFSFQSTLTHYLGHLAGLAHSCESDDTCTDPALLDATMYWETAPCDTRQSTVEMDDAWTLATVYGTPVRVECTRDEADGTAVSCVLSEPVAAPVSWDFGDGETSTLPSVSHSYADSAERVVRACVTVETCGADYCYDLRVPAGAEDESDTSAPPADEGGAGCAAVPGSTSTTAGGGAEGSGSLGITLAVLLRRRRRGDRRNAD